MLPLDVRTRMAGPVVTPWYRDPTVVERNRLPMNGLPPPEDRLVLDGPWHFRHHSGPPIDDDWHGSVEPPWSTVEVPGSWVLQGHGIPIYTNVDYPFPIDDYPDIPLPDETGDHWRRVEIPTRWTDRRVVLRIGAAESAVEVWVGGHWIGCSTDSRLPAEFDVTEAIEPGRPTVIALRVHRWSASTWLEDQDMWWMAGLHRSVTLTATEAIHLADVRFVTERLSPDRKRAEVTVAAEVGGADPKTVDVFATLTGPHGRVVLDRVPLRPAEGGDLVAGAVIEDPFLWSAETPQLYDLGLELRSPGDGDGGPPIDRRHLAVGVRTVAVERGRLTVNGRPVTLRGVNRHEHDANDGRVQTDELLAADGALLKAANVNAVRTAHYPNDERFYQLCDRIGLYVIDEANIETHGLVHHPDRLPADDGRFATAFESRCRRMVRRDRNHPCVIAWSLGNESGFGANHRIAAAAVRAEDPTRPLHYHPAEDDPVVDIIGPMYPTRGELQAMAEIGDHRPVIMCEYSHAMGNSNGGLAVYWDLVHAHHRLGGGFIWDWVDQGIARLTDDGRRWWAYGGDFGDKPNDENFNCNGLVDADRRAHPALLHVAWVYRPVAVRLAPGCLGDHRTCPIEIENRRDHRDLSDLSLTWRLLDARGELAAGTVEDLAPVGPGRRIELDLALGDDLQLRTDDGELRLRVEWRGRADRSGPTGVDWTGAPAAYRRLVAWDELPLPTGVARGAGAGADQAIEWRPAVSVGASPIVEIGPETTTVSGGGSVVELDRLGRPRALVLAGVDLPLLDARLGIWRAPTDNDDATFGPDRVVTRLRRAGLEGARLEPVDRAPVGPAPDGIDRPAGGVADAVFGLTAAGTSLRLTCRWLAAADGDVAVELGAVSGLDAPPLLRLGFELDVSSHLRRLEWFGPGPIESYPDRVRGLLVDRHRSSVDDELFPYARPQESGNHTAVRWMALTDERGAGLVAIGDPYFDGAALPVGEAELTRAQHLHELRWPDHTVLRLDGAHGGLGTASCGPGVDRRFEVDARTPVRNRIILRPLAPGDDPAEVAARPSVLHRPQRWHYG